MKRGRGRPSKATLAAAAVNGASRSSVATSTYGSADSVSGYSTPMTSNVTTPAPSLLMDKHNLNPDSTSTRSPQSSKLEVVIPMRKTRDSAAERIQKAKDFMMSDTLSTSKQTKRKRNVIPDSEGDDSSDGAPNAGRTRHDEKIARQLQEELDREAAEALIIDDDGDDEHGNGPAAQQDVEANSDSEDYPMADRKGKGKAVYTRRPRTSRAAAQDYVVPDLSEDDEDDDLSDSDYNVHPVKKLRIHSTGRAQQAASKGKQSLAAESNSDDDAPGKLQTSKNCPLLLFLSPISNLLLSYPPMPYPSTDQPSSLPISNPLLQYHKLSCFHLSFDLDKHRRCLGDCVPVFFVSYLLFGCREMSNNN